MTLPDSSSNARVPTNPNLNAVLRGRTELLATRFEVAAVQIIERLRIRAQNLQQILEEDLEIGSRRLAIGSGSPFPSPLFNELDGRLIEKQSWLQRERRLEEKECWRDLTMVMRDLLNAWEALSQAKAKERFLEGLSARSPPADYDLPSARSYHAPDDPN